MGRGRGRGGGGRGFRGGGRSTRGRGGRGVSVDKRDARHLRMFGEQHPSKDLKDDEGEEGRNGPSTSKRWRGQDVRDRREVRKEEEEDSEEEEEESAYHQLLAVLRKKKGDGGKGVGTNKDKVQIVTSDEEDEEEEENDNPDEQSSDEDDKVENDDDHQPALAAGGGGVSHPVKEPVDEEEEEEEEGVGNNEETVIEDAEINPEMENAGDKSKDTSDPFLLHFERSMPDYLLSRLKSDDNSPKKKIISTHVWPEVDKFVFQTLEEWKEINEEIKKDRDLQGGRGAGGLVDISLVDRVEPLILPNPPGKTPKCNPTLEGFSIKPQLQTTFPVVNHKIIDDKDKGGSALSPMQGEMLEFMSQYFDGYFPIRDAVCRNEEEIINAYCLHAANHILKTRTRILHHNAKMGERVDVPDSYRDQGFVRPKVLILAPFKSTAYKIIKTLLSLLLPEQKGSISHKKRFEEEYSGSTLFLPKTNPKPEDYNATFGGNVEDNFKIGLSLTKKSVKLYTGFYSSDIIVASPLGLRMIVGAEGEKGRDYDFLSSIELLIMDQADIFLMQNWDHVLHLMRHLHLQPVTTHGTDFARIRPWALDGLSPFFRQTLIFSSIFCPELSSLLTKHCRNFAGGVRLIKEYPVGSISGVTVPVPQVFQYFEATSLSTMDDDRFSFFIEEVLPTFAKDKLMSHTLIFVSSYFDFVRLRNHLKREGEGISSSSFVQICEYTKDKKIARARDHFYHGKGHFLLYTERAHFFRRLRIKGVGHIVFYQLPQYPHFYSELCNFIQEEFQNRRVRLRRNASITVTYCKYDAGRLSPVVGTERCSLMLSSDKRVHAFINEK